MKQRAIWIFDRSYALPTLLSVAGFRQHSSMPVTLLYCEAEHNPEVQQAFSHLSDVSFELYQPNIELPPSRFNNHVINRLARMVAMERWPDEVVALFDSDLFFAGSTDALFAHAQHKTDRPAMWGVVEFDRAYENDFYTEIKDLSGKRHRTSERERLDCYQRVFGQDWTRLLAHPQYNNGVLLFHQCAEVATQWRKIYLHGLQDPEVNKEDDQLPLSVALYEADCPVGRLDARWNSLGKLSGDYSIFHAWSNFWKRALVKAVNNSPIENDLDRLIRSTWSQVPPTWLEAIRQQQMQPAL